MAYNHPFNNFTAPPETDWMPSPRNSLFASVTITTGTFPKSGELYRLLSFQTCSGDNVIGEYRTLTSASNYTATAYIDSVCSGNAIWGQGISVRNSTSGAALFFGINSGSNGHDLAVFRMSNNTTWNNNAANTTIVASGSLSEKMRATANLKWLRIRDDGTNRYFEFSTDGEIFVTFHSQARTTDVTADQIGWGCNPNSVNGTGLMYLRSWSVV